MHPDFEELLSALNDEDVKYLIVGGYAVLLHAQPRATGIAAGNGGVSAGDHRRGFRPRLAAARFGDHR